jgi:hypothetical protein
MDRYRALAELTRTGIAPGADTARHLADAGIRGKQQLNSIQDSARFTDQLSRADPGSEDYVRRLDTLVDDWRRASCCRRRRATPRPAACCSPTPPPVPRYSA